MIKEVDKEVEAKERALLVWDSHMKALIDSDLQKRLPYEVLHGSGFAPSYSTQLEELNLHRSQILAKKVRGSSTGA